MSGAAVHQKFGGSTAERWLVCPGSVRLAETVPPTHASAYMQAGTHAHALLELALREQRQDVTEFEGQRLAPEFEPFTADDVAAVQVAVDHVGLLLSLDPDAVLNIEFQALVYPHVGGTADVVLYLPKTRTMHVLDYKHGAGKFVDTDTPQIKLYMLGVLVNFHEPVETITGTVIQPRNGQGDAVRSVTYTVGAMLDFYATVDEAVANAESDEPRFAAGAHCRWCPAAHVCPLLANSTTTMAAPWRPGSNAVTLTLPSPADCDDPVKLAETLRAVRVVDGWIKAIEDRAFAVAMTGAELPGFKLVQKRATRKFDSETAARGLLEDLGLTPAEYAPPALLSVAQAEKIVKARHGAKGVAALAKIVNAESSGLNLVPVEAKGEAVHPLKLAASGFGSVTTLE